MPRTSTITICTARRRSHEVSAAIFADASFFIALFTAKDEYHARARAWQRYMTRGTIPVVTTEAALWEWLNFCAVPAARVRASEAYRSTRDDQGVDVVDLTPALRGAAVKLYAQRVDKSWGITDCLSFMVMQQRAIVDALTADHHFEQAGFRALLQHEPPA